MKANPFKKSIKIQWLIRILLSITVISVFLPNNLLAKTAREIDVSLDVALITIGAGERADTTTSKDPIVGFVFDAKGLIADLSLKGAKFTKLNKAE